MVVDNQSNKRRRLDQPTALEQTNATLQHFIGARHNRWMHGFTSTPNATNGPAAQPHPHGTAHAHAAAANTRAARANAHAANSRPTAASAASRREVNTGSSDAVPSSRPSYNEPSLSAQQNQNQNQNLVSYEAPPQTETVPSMFALQPPSSSSAAAAVTGRKSVDLTRAAGPGLPSPAPSDENNNSPVLANAHSVQQQQRPRSVVQTRNPSLPFTLPPSASPILLQQTLPPQHPARQQMAYSQSPPVAGPSNPQFIHQRQHSHPRPGLQHRQSVPGNFQPAPPPNAVLPSNDGPVRQPVAYQASRIPPNMLLQRMDMKMAELRQSSTLSGTDTGRLCLLREAVEKGDWFYQTLSQLCCLRSVSPALLPRSIRDLSNDCYALVDGLLCPNSSVHPELLTFFAEFPEPIMDIYSDPSQGVREVFESRVNSIKAFLCKLPPFWDSVVTKCKQLRAPPLVQDLFEILHMKSPVLQTTAFRAIARMFFGMRDTEPRSANAGEIISRGVNAVEMVHRIDQDTFHRQLYRRTPAEKTEAYHRLRRVFEQWTMYKQHEQATRGAIPDFQPAQDILRYFQRVPDSMMQQQMQQQLQQHIHQPQAHNMLRQVVTNGQLQQLQNRREQVYTLGGSGSPTNAQSPVNPPSFRPPGPGSQGPFQSSRAGSSQMPRQPQLQLYHPIRAQPRPQPTHPDTTRAALHQAHLRSPRLKPLVADSPQLYRHVIGFGVPPTKLRKDLSQMIKFHVTQALMARMPRTEGTVMMAGEPRRRAIGEDTYMYRLRCSALPPSGFASENAWVTAENYWPEEYAYEFNGKMLEMRRKLHHGRYLPVDLTDLIQLGENTLKVFRNHNHNDKRQHSQYALAIEVIGVTSHPTILSKTPRIPAETSLNAIKKSLSGSDDNDDEDDDDLAVTSSSLSITLFDPYTGCKIFDIPVRGASCLHRDCFDLETFLSQCKRQHGWPIVDCWRCPLCRGDVRPQTLVIDEFLVRVREQLAAQGKLETRAIVVEADGSWKAKEEERSGVRSPSLEREEQEGPVPMSAPAKKVIEVIELDDD